MLSPAARFAIEDLYARFTDAVARRSGDALRALFSATASVEGPTEPPRTGVDAIVDSMVHGFARWEVLLLASHSLLVLDEDTAVRTRWYVTEFGRRDGDDVLYSGVYHDEVVEEADAWRFARRRFDLLYARTGTGSLVVPFPAAFDRP
jgi:hypothetical protein